MRRSPDLLPLDEALGRLHPFARFHLGVRAIPVRQIVGSDGRAADFDRRFVPRRRESLVRLRELGRVFPHGDFPPIVVHQLGETYFVVDGHHRVALARQRGMETLDAAVTVVRARWRLHEDAGPEDLVHAEQEWLFMEESGLGETRPEAEIRFSKPIGYSQLLAGVEAHGYRMALATGEVVARGLQRAIGTTASTSRHSRLSSASDSRASARTPPPRTASCGSLNSSGSSGSTPAARPSTTL